MNTAARAGDRPAPRRCTAASAVAVSFATTTESMACRRSRGRPAVLLQDAPELRGPRASDDQRQPQTLAAAIQLDRPHLAVGDAHASGVGESVVEREAVSDTEVVAVGRRVEVERHRNGLVVAT